jgi:hypothetical protein
LVSAVPAAPDRYYALELPYSETGLPGGASPVVAEVVIVGVEALIAYTDDDRVALGAIFDEAQDPAFPEPINVDVLRAIAGAVTKRLWLANRDAWVGMHRAHGLLPLHPEGRRARITWEVADTGACYTAIELAEIPVRPLETLLPAWVLRRLGGEPVPT